jgi:hypothetical protein
MQNEEKQNKQRILKPSLQPYVFIGVMLGALAILFSIPYFQVGLAKEAVRVGAVWIFFFLAVCIVAPKGRIVATENSITFKSFGKSAQAIPFKDITKSNSRCVQTSTRFAMVSETILDVYTKNSEEKKFSIPLSRFRTEDVNWLLSLPALKVQNQSGKGTIKI